MIQFIKTTPKDAAVDKSVTWTSSDESVATVDSNGKVTATGLGSVTITAESKKAFKNGKKKGTITLNVVNFNVSMRVFIPELKNSDSSTGTSDYVLAIATDFGSWDGFSGRVFNIGDKINTSETISFIGETNEVNTIGTTYEFYDSAVEKGRLKSAAIQEMSLLSDGQSSNYVKNVKTLSVEKAKFDNSIISKGNNSLTYQMKADAGNPLVFMGYFLPDIDYQVKITIRQKNNGKYSFKISGKHNKFPNYEIKLKGRDIYKYKVSGRFENYVWGTIEGLATSTGSNTKDTEINFNVREVKEKEYIDFSTSWQPL